ncbi:MULTISPECIES: DUF1295 domain-containing protein [unclassified Thioalkalivibrio]|uniref:DUF1295 domain-containing protein n=1 Tax=unclassified Thioalkalivibrio TaxID=2621013 RepID=UPI00035FCFC6|nr:MULTISPECIES: DUF1295 domain-containing protein [unclassified Thioalkalivibrio]
METLMAFLWGLLASMGLMTLVWAGSVWRHDASLVDRFWGLGFVVVTLVWWGLAGWPSQGLWIAIPVLVWGLRLSLFITWRNWGHGEDGRYTDMREGLSDRAFAARSLVTIFWLQGALVAVIGLPMLAVTNAASIWWPLAALGASVWVLGTLYESVADAQMARFRGDPARQGKVMDQGLWRYSRHPNYFGEIVVWVGYGLLALAAGGWWAVPSAILMIVLILRVSGVTLLEKRLHASRPGYADYARRTNTLIPGPPRS